MILATLITNRPAAWRRAALLVFTLLLASSAAGAGAPVTVTQAPVTVSRRSFDPQHPPADMPPLNPPEAGVCWSEYSCATQASLEGPKVRNPKTPSRVISISVNLRLEVIIWTVARAPEKLRAHEEAHRQIAEYYYARAAAIIRQRAEGMIGRKLAVAADNSPAMQSALENLQGELQASFRRETSDRCSFAQDEFDKISRHGLNPISEHDALTRALAAEAARK